MDGQQSWTFCDEAGAYVVPNVSSPRDLVSRPDDMDETVLHTLSVVVSAEYVTFMFLLTEYKSTRLDQF